MHSFFPRRIGRTLLLTLVLVSLGSCRKDGTKPKETWDPITNNPDTLRPDGMTSFEKEFFALPLEGQLERDPWAEDYWPSYLGGISMRWFNNPRKRESGPERFDYQPPTRETVARMSLDEKRTLSPAEKYSIFIGDYSYRLVHAERERVVRVPGPGGAMIVRPEKPWLIPTWEGLCHAWTPASVFFQEPRPITLKNSEGIEVPFGSSDVKALLIRLVHEDQGFSGESHFLRSVGVLCTQELDAGAEDEACTDTNPGAFHVILANRIGLLRQPLFADMHNGTQIWNHPLFAYKSDILSIREPEPGAAPEAVRQVVVRTVVTYAVETVPNWNAHGTSPKERILFYSLELDGDNNIIGGEWLRGNLTGFEFTKATDLIDRPDNLWIRGEPRWSWNRNGIEWLPLKEIYEKSIAQQ